jgi:hypothetical protein
MKHYKHSLYAVTQLQTNGRHRRHAYYKGKYMREIVSVGIFLALVIYIL